MNAETRRGESKQWAEVTAGDVKEGSEGRRVEAYWLLR